MRKVLSVLSHKGEGRSNAHCDQHHAADRPNTASSIKHSKCSSKIITSILPFNSGRRATKSNQNKQLTRTGKSARQQRAYKNACTNQRQSSKNKARDVRIGVRNNRALRGRFN